MQPPKDDDFTVRRDESSVEVIFTPTHSIYRWMLLADPRDIAQLGPLSEPPTVRHAGQSGDTDGCWPARRG
jgi:hypothetical protein